MPRVAYGAGAYRRTAGNLAELRLINMFLETAPLQDSPTILLSRQGLTLNTSPGAGPVSGIFTQDGVFDGALFTVSDSKLYMGTTLLGSVPGPGPVSWAGRAGELLVTAGEHLYSYNGTNFALVAFPDSAYVAAVRFHDGLFLAVRRDTHKTYYSAVTDGRDWDSLDFFSAEDSPDVLLDMEILGDTLWLFGSGTIEPWVNTGDADAPYTRLEGRTFSKGVLETGVTVEMDNSALFVGSDGIVYRLGDVPERISDHSIEERIANTDEIFAFWFVIEGHSFYCLRFDDSTFAFDIATQQWCEFATYGRDNFRGRCAVMDGDQVIFGDDDEGKTWTLSGYDDHGDALERLFSAGFSFRGGSMSVDNLMIEANVGWTELLTGQGSDPVAEMRSSRDAGATWSSWRQADLGEQGQYRTKTQWRRLGMFDWPGALFEVRVTDPCGVRISGVYVNEAGGGRSR